MNRQEVPPKPPLPPPLPYAEIGEKGLLGTLMHDLKSALEPKYFPDLFYLPRNKIIFGVIVDLAANHSEITFEVLVNELKKINQLEEVGGRGDLNELWDLSFPGIYYESDVFDAYQRRCTILDCRRKEKAAFDRSEPASAYDPTGAFAVTPDLLGLPPVESADSLLAENIKEPPEIVRGLVHQGSKNSIGGGSKAFKTFVLTDIAVSIAAGVPWLGFDTIAGKVLYVNLEIQRPFYKKRIAAIAAAKGLPASGAWRKNLDVWNLRGYCVDAETLCKLLRKMSGYLAIVIDPIYKIVGSREENSNDQIASLLNLLEQVAHETGAALFSGNHFSKGNQAGKESIDRISGAGVFARDPDSIITATRHEKDDAYTVEFALRNFPPVDPFCVRWEYPRFVRDETLDPSKLKQGGGRPAKWTVEQLVDCLGSKDLGTVDFQKLVAAERGMPRTSFYELLPQAKTQGLLHKCVTDDKWEVVRK